MAANLQAVPPRPGRVLPGFGHITRYWDRGRHIYGAKILPGEFYVTTHEEYISTVLGSCVSACIRDRIFGIGGMNHFMLPHTSEYCSGQWGSCAVSSETRYGINAMEQLINTILKNGGDRRNLEVKVFGGGRILQQMTDIGRRNIHFVREYIEAEGLTLLAEDLGDIYPRKVLFFPRTGGVKVKKLRSLHNTTILERETHYLHDIEEQQQDAGEIELF